MNSYIKYLCLLPILAFAGCGGISAPIQGQAEPYAATQIDFTDQGLASQTTIGTIRPVRDPQSNILTVTVPIRAATDQQLYVDYRVTWYDRNHVPLGPATGWTAKTLAPNVFDEITVNSFTPQAADFRIDLRYAE